MKTLINLATGTTEQAELTQSELDQQAADKVVYDAEQVVRALTQYQRDRASAYPSLGDQLDALFHAGVFPAEMAAEIQAVKDAHPKPEV